MVLLGLSWSSIAEDKTTAKGEIKRLHFWHNINGVLILHTNMGVNPGCARDDQYVLSKNHPYYKDMYALLLAAAAANKKVQLSLSNAECPGSYPAVKHIWVEF